MISQNTQFLEKKQIFKKRNKEYGTTSKITLKVSTPNAPTKRQKLSDWIKEQDVACTCKKPTSNI